ncbi:MAG: hypothetical protein HY754_05535 [Nitrospirae bacterium]|nr:hypothetical protein [Nitrospirota bacterium]
MKRTIKVIIFLIAGFAAGTAIAKLSFPGYKHAMVTIKKAAESKPLYIGVDGGRYVLALSMKNLQRSKDIEIRMAGAEIHSWYPPVIRMPFSNPISFEAGRFKEVEFGKRLPVYVVFNDNGENRKIEIIDSMDGSRIQTINVLRCKDHEDHSH